MTFALLILSLLNGPQAAGTPLPGPYVAIRVDYQNAVPEPADSTNPKRLGEQRGSGVVVGRADEHEWFVLTNAHVVEADDGIERTIPNIFAGGAWRPGKVVSIDSEVDLALIRFRFNKPLNFVTVAESSPADEAEVRSCGFAGGRKFCYRTSTLRLSLPLPDGAQAWAPHRYYVRTIFNPGESGGAVTLDHKLVALIHGNDLAAGWGLVVDHQSIKTFLDPFLSTPALEP